MKKFVLVVVTAFVYLAAYNVSAHAASTSPYDVPTYARDYHQGYFTDARDTSGDDVLQNDANDPSRAAHRNSSGGYDAIKPATNTADELIAEIESRLNSNRVDPTTANNARNWDRTGAAFIIQTMIGSSRNRPPTAAELTEWRARVRHAEATGHINWSVPLSFSLNTFYQINRRDGSSSVNDAAFYNGPGGGQGIVFYHDNGSVAYILRRACANPVGTLSPLSDDLNFSISASSGLNNTTPAPGEVMQFTHSITSSAPTNPVRINWTTQDYPSLAAIASGSVGPLGAGTIGVAAATENYRVPIGTPVGSQICRRMAFSPANQSGGSGAGPQVCGTVRYNYNLNPTVVPNQTTVQDGDTLTFTYRIENSGTTPSAPAQCYVRDAANNPVAVSLACSGSQVFPITAPMSVGTETINITGVTAGASICRRLYIQPATPSVANRASSLTCVVVAKSPYVRFGGNDVWAGGGFQAVTPGCNTSAKITTSGRALGGTAPVEYAGSSVEYNAFALNRVFAFGSAGRALVGSGALGDLSRSMTFANNEANPALIGHYGASQHCLEDYSSLYESLPVGAALPIANPTSGVWHSASLPSLSGPVPAGVTKVYYSDGDVTITGDITYPASYANRSQIPSILVVAKGNIYVAPTVRRMDGVYVTRGTFYTCYPKVEPSDVGICANQLTVNGAVIANRLDLFRTAGGDGPTVPARKSPAELFNFSPEVYLRNAVHQTAEPTIQVLNSIELPPRF